MTSAEIITHLSGYRFHYSDEKELQQGIEKCLKEGGFPLEREVDLGEPGRIDFFGQGIGIEIKIKGSPSDVAEQAVRYCSSPKIEELIVVTGRSLSARLPEKIRDKPVHVLPLWKSMI